MKPLTMRQIKALRSLAWGTEHFDGLATGRITRRSTVMGLVERGLAQSIGMSVSCDGDGFALQPERYREAFAITPAGTRALAKADAEAERIAAERRKNDLETAP